MEKVTKSYVEKTYRGGLICNETYEEEVEERNPMKVENDDEVLLQRFRFYDRGLVVGDAEKTCGDEKSNYSNWFYFGERLSLEEIKEQYGNDPYRRSIIDNWERDGYKYVCHTQASTFVPMEDGDMTLDEYIANYEKGKVKTR